MAGRGFLWGPLADGAVSKLVVVEKGGVGVGGGVEDDDNDGETAVSGSAGAGKIL